jgi:hypothetical protein
MKRSMLVLAAALVLLFSGAARAVDFALGFDGCQDTVRGAPGSAGTLDLFATLTSSNNTTADGAQGWSLSIRVDGATSTAISVKGVHVSTIFDDDGDPSTPLVDPFDLDIGGNNPPAGFKIAQLAVDPLNPAITGAVSAVVLNNTQKMVLHPNGTERLAKLTLGYTIPAEGSTSDIVVTFVNGLKGAGQPVNNVVTFNGASQTPALGGCTIHLAPVGAEFNLALVGLGLSPAASGDTVLEKTVDAGADNSVDVSVLLTTNRLTPPDGPQGWSLSVANDACMTVDSVTVKGVHVSTIFDDDGDPTTPLVDPFDLDIGGNNPPAGFKIAQKAVGVPPLDPAITGVVSAVVLNNTQKMVLHANATDTLLKITYKLPAVQEGQTLECKASFLDGLKGAGQPVSNVITFNGASKKPTNAQGLVIRLTGKVPPQKSHFIRGDPNNDGKNDIADAITIVYAVVPSLGGHPVACPDSGDVNADGHLDLADAIYIINYQFKGGPKPGDPFPGCGTTDASTADSCPAGATACGG